MVSGQPGIIISLQPHICLHLGHSLAQYGISLQSGAKMFILQNYLLSKCYTALSVSKHWSHLPRYDINCVSHQTTSSDRSLLINGNTLCLKSCVLLYTTVHFRSTQINADDKAICLIQFFALLPRIISARRCKLS